MIHEVQRRAAPPAVLHPSLCPQQNIGLDEVERLFRRPRSKAKERLVDALLELLATCKYVTISFRLYSTPSFLGSSSYLLPLVSLQAVLRSVRQEVSITSQQAGQMPEGLHQKEFGECFLRILSTIPLSLCQAVSSPSGQILIARQAIRIRRRVTRRTVKQRLMESRKILKTLRILAKEVSRGGLGDVTLLF